MGHCRGGRLTMLRCEARLVASVVLFEAFELVVEDQVTPHVLRHLERRGAAGHPVTRARLLRPGEVAVVHLAHDSQALRILQRHRAKRDEERAHEDTEGEHELGRLIWDDAHLVPLLLEASAELVPVVPFLQLHRWPRPGIILVIQQLA